MIIRKEQETGIDAKTNVTRATFKNNPINRQGIKK